MALNASIEDVSDTALWVAVYRGREGDRSDSLFQDPLAARLAGPRGESIARSMPGSKYVEWALVVRTVAIDGLISKAVHDGADAVINLGAGLDTRPYRMRLPKDLRWIEVDFPKMIDYKNAMLKDETPCCRLERWALDLSDRKKRRELFERIGSEVVNAVILTEGVIFYLSNDEASGLAEDLHSVPSFRGWIQDYRDGGLSTERSIGWNAALKNAPMKFKTDNWLGFFAKLGWTPQQNVWALDEARRIRRSPPFMFPWSLIGWFLSSAQRERIRRGYGFVFLKRTSPAAASTETR